MLTDPARVANKLDPAKQIRYKKSAMPFVQMENISHFLSFVAKPPVSLPPHDLFLTVDLYEKKDPAQVVQCLTSFSRIAHTLNASAFPNTIGGVKATALSPQISGGSDSSSVRRALSNGDKSSGAPPLPGRKPAVSTWSRKADEGATLPAWNIAQYGYMGGASQGNQGISFGGRRQITATPASTASPAGTARLRNQSPAVSEVGSPTGSALSPTGSAFSPTGSAFSPTGSAFSPIGTSFLDRDRARKQQVREEAETRQREEEEARQRAEAEAAEAAQAIQEQADLEARQRVEADEAEAAREAAKQEEEKQAAILEERRLWKAEEEKRLLWQQEQDRARELERAKKSEAPTPSEDDRSAEREKIRQLEEELARARERERTFEAELQRQKENKSGSEDEERRFLQGAWKAEKDMYQHRPATPPQQTNQKPLKIFQRTPGSRSPPKPPPRALPTPPRTLAVKSVDLGRSDSTASWMAGDDSKPLDSPSKEKKDFKWARYASLT